MKTTEVLYPEGIREEYLICKNWSYVEGKWQKTLHNSEIVSAFSADGAIDAELRLQLEWMQEELGKSEISLPTFALRPVCKVTE